MHCKVKDVMTTDVVCASPETPYKELVRLLERHRVSALPVTDDRRHAVGVVSEVNLLLKQELPAAGGRAPLLERRRRRLQRAKARGLVAEDVMTSPVVSIGQIPVVVAAVYGVDGVVGVDNQLDFDTNDTLLTPVFP